MHSIHLQWYLQRYNEHNEFRKYRATDIAEREVMRAIHEIRTREPLCEELIAAHRDSSIYNGTLIDHSDAGHRNGAGVMEAR